MPGNVSGTHDPNIASIHHQVLGEDLAVEKIWLQFGTVVANYLELLVLANGKRYLKKGEYNISAYTYW